MLENLSVRMQLLLLTAILVVLFIAVRLNAKHNRKKRNIQEKRDLGQRLEERRKEREEQEKNRN